MRRLPLSTAAPLGALLLIGSTACGDASPVDPGADALAPAMARHAARVETNQGLAALRAATAAYHRLEAAEADGFEALTPCLSNESGPGAMGYHYGNVEMIDEKLSVDAPELLVYAPHRDGGLRLVAVEWLIPTALVDSSDPPELLGHHFHEIAGTPFWGLHAWVWFHNPDGMFADFNPRVSCG